MWTPANQNALPSQEEIGQARKAIEMVEIERKAAVEVLKRAQMVVDNLDKDLDIRRAWIAPIRKMPIEILSEIFIFASEMDHLAPMVFSEVSRSWREIILSTPRAWSMIYLENHTKKRPQYASTFLERSAPCLLHLNMPEDYLDHIEPTTTFPVPIKGSIIAYAHRIQCLSLTAFQLAHFEQVIFPALSRLTLSEGEQEISLTSINPTRFPCLRFLDSSLVNWRMHQIDCEVTLPPLRHLSMRDNSNSIWVAAIQSCAATLETLEIQGRFTSAVSALTPVHFPRLTYMSIELLYDEEAIVWPIQARTPVLVIHEEHIYARQDETFTLHTDVTNVTHLQTYLTTHLSNYVSLQVLQLMVSRDATIECIKRLQEDPSLCPKIKTVEFDLSMAQLSDWSSTPVALIQPGTKVITRDDGTQFTVIVAEEWSMEFTGSLNDHRVSSCLLPGHV